MEFLHSQVAMEKLQSIIPLMAFFAGYYVFEVMGWRLGINGVLLHDIAWLESSRKGV